MKLKKPNFWQEKNHILSIIFFPISLIIQLLLKAKKKLVISKSFKMPVICVGNIYLGGTGKTPLVLTIARELINYKIRPAIVKKFYKDHLDEHNLIRNNLDCLFLDNKRSKAIKMAENNEKNFVILDDGFQDFSIKKDLNILCFNSNQLIGNGFTIPSGPLREGLKSMKYADVIVINGDKNELFEKKINSFSKNAKIFYSRYVPDNIEEFKNKDLFAFAGIGNPENFFKLLNNNKLKIKKTISFPDHYKFERKELEKIVMESKKNNLEIITTEKDYFRIKDLGLKQIKYLKVKLEIKEKEKLIKYLLDIKK